MVGTVDFIVTCCCVVETGDEEMIKEDIHVSDTATFV